MSQTETRFTELDVIELGPWCDYLPDEPSPLEHRIAKANDLTYGCPPRHWKWKGPLAVSSEGESV